MADEHYDVVIVGAGISGIGAACHLTRECPDRSYAILERRPRLGGTWDLFRFPGVRSDSDMYTFGYDFRPWHDTRVVADGASIREYLAATATEYRVQEHIRFGRRMTTARWSSSECRWSVDAVEESTGARDTITADFLLCCTGYFNYDTGYRPTFPGEQEFQGPVVHPQQWPADLEHAGRRVVIIGSGATAVTLVPALAQTAAHVTMLQRSPSWIVSVPGADKISAALGKVLPGRVVYSLARARNVAVQRASYAGARAWPRTAAKLLLSGVRKRLGADVDLAGFTPNYEPWDQRLCVVPDGDLFAAVRSGRADVVTGEVASLTITGIRLASGAELAADLIVTATGLDLQLLGGATLEVDGTPVALNRRLTYKGVLIEDVPNAAVVFGYTNASWTLKADLAARYVCRLLNDMRRRRYATVVAHAPAGARTDRSVMSALAAGYVRRGDGQLPRQGTHGVWRVRNDYYRDAWTLRRAPIADDALTFTPAAAR